MVDGWDEDGVKPIIYINPYFANLKEPYWYTWTRSGDCRPVKGVEKQTQNDP